MTAGDKLRRFGSRSAFSLRIGFRAQVCCVVLVSRDDHHASVPAQHVHGLDAQLIAAAKRSVAEGGM